MKIRAGFVSNSSSSSFLCDVCSRTESGMDMSLSDAGMSQCINAHTFCDEHKASEVIPRAQLQLLADLLESSKGSSWMLDIEESLSPKMVGLDKSKGKPYYSDAIGVVYAEFQEVIEEEWPYDVPVSVCPICSFQALLPADVCKYLLKRLNMTEEGLLQELSGRFSDYKEFKGDIKCE